MIAKPSVMNNCIDCVSFLKKESEYSEYHCGLYEDSCKPVSPCLKKTVVNHKLQLPNVPDNVLAGEVISTLIQLNEVSEELKTMFLEVFKVEVCCQHGRWDAADRNPENRGEALWLGQPKNDYRSVSLTELIKWCIEHRMGA